MGHSLVHEHRLGLSSHPMPVARPPCPLHSLSRVYPVCPRSLFCRKAKFSQWVFARLVGPAARTEGQGTGCILKLRGEGSPSLPEPPRYPVCSIPILSPQKQRSLYAGSTCVWTRDTGAGWGVLPAQHDHASPGRMEVGLRHPLWPAQAGKRPQP